MSVLPVTTLVTAYYFVSQNTTKKNVFMDRAIRTMKIDQPLVIFCEKENKEEILQMRQDFKEKTIIIELPYKNLYFYKYREIIEKNRELYWPTRDERAPTDVHIICVSKFSFLKQAMEENPFNTPYFAWIDFNLLSKTPNNCDNYLQDNIYTRINNICYRPKSKFSIQVINCWSPDSYSDLKKFYSSYAWIVSGQFYTMDRYTGLFIINKLIEKVEQVTLAGFGHGDESFFAYIIDQYPELFQLSLGDYQDTIHNYYEVTSNHSYVQWVHTLYQQRNLSQRLSRIYS